MKSNLPYCPGVIPSKPSPQKGYELRFEVEGLPPYKDVSKSIRNKTHRAHERFILLREKAIQVMDGRAWYFDAISLSIVIFGNDILFDKSIQDYMSGIMDTLGGSSGFTFTFLPIVYEDDSQVCEASYIRKESDVAKYQVLIKFL
ncbi:MAG: hypothetical protein PVI26_09910 [Chitinispirillia bacterium]|jgi:hypothetical protein